MNFKSRKLRVGLISLATVLAVYLICSRLSKTPQIKIDTAAESAGVVDEFENGVGRVGDIGIGTVEVAEFITLNKNKEIDRKWGFKKLLHQEGNEWELEKPFMDIYRRNLKCCITSDRGRILLESDVGRPSPKEGTLAGNVIIRILPENNSDIEESTVYLDSVDFISERSLFRTDGPVRFISTDAQMLGTGMELVYNDQLGRLEFLRIIHLKSLRIKTSSQASLFSSGETDIDRKADTSSQLQTKQPAKPVAADNSQKVKRVLPANKKGENYRCVFSKNVVVDCPEQLVFADEVFINNIFFAKGSSEDSNKSDTVNADNVKEHGAAIAKQSEPNGPQEEFIDIIVTCDNGFIVTPMNSTGSYVISTEPHAELTATDNRATKDINDPGSRITFVARRIDYCVSTENVVANGPSKLTFYVNDPMREEPNRTVLPVKVTAQKKTSFLPALNQVIFEGDCRCTMIRAQSDIQEKYTLSAPRFTVDLSSNKASAADIEHFTADGGVVRLATIKTAQEEMLGGIELKCLKFDFDPNQQLFWATGPNGTITVDNSKIAEPKKKTGKFSLQKPCYAFVRDFETLKYFLEANQIVADAAPQGTLRIDYFPIVKGEYGQQVSATAGHIVANLVETADGQNKLSTLSATGGITYEEEAKKKKWGKGKAIQFVGGDFFYDADKALITAWGDKSQPCLLNGVLVEAIKYNLKTGRAAKAKIVGPGMLK